MRHALLLSAILLLLSCRSAPKHEVQVQVEKTGEDQPVARFTWKMTQP